ncbi:hypothetical protein [Methylobacterium aerolatum]|uniref:Uncharacterized protein n=1 Tax=Methylobacterium aerolatum TaxID=418708 RepID=A0ABU0HYA7_9HYPH|nr:hypothetical protein [Methylobacterium aerolatum]MDQ0447301.1 hypothetical protein [Methylobacterium aerolatum]GJD36965.1 hypothetical protein FMGBMHLM_3891 [Methylobacterium aerolatum]
MLRSLALGAACVFACLATAEARTTRTATAEPQAAEATSAVRPVSVTTPEPGPACGRSRRRLWIEGEGWVVRKVPTCR